MSNIIRLNLNSTLYHLTQYFRVKTDRKTYGIGPTYQYKMLKANNYNDAYLHLWCVTAVPKILILTHRNIQTNSDSLSRYIWIWTSVKSICYEFRKSERIIIIWFTSISSLLSFHKSCMAPIKLLYTLLFFEYQFKNTTWIMYCFLHTLQ